uniref:Uncharacterized protein n=1 Tax=Peronospora matthiolae TaxID=2874970 RepID=A0AAV1TU64_9STRA
MDCINFIELDLILITPYPIVGTGPGDDDVVSKSSGDRLSSAAERNCDAILSLSNSPASSNMRIRCIVFAVSSSFLRGSAESMVDGDRPDVVAIDQSTLPRLNTDASDGPGLLRTFNKTVNTTAAVTPRPLDDSAVDETTLEEQQSERWASLDGAMGRLRDSLYLLQKRSPGKRFQDMFGGRRKAFTPGAFNDWLKYVAKFRARHGEYSDEDIFQMVWERVPKADRKKLLQQLKQTDVGQDHTLLQQWLSSSLKPQSDVVVNYWKSQRYSPKSVLNGLDIDFFAEPELAIHWLRFNEEVGLTHPGGVVSFDDIAIYMETHVGRSHDAGANPHALASNLLVPSPLSDDGFFDLVKKAHTKGKDNLDEIAKRLEDTYTRLRDEPKHAKYSWQPSPAVT